jgi:hypothetical protein
MREQQRVARSPYKVKLNNQHMPEIIKKKFEVTHIKDIIKKLQTAINESITEGNKPILQAGNKYPNGIRLQCDTPEDAQLLRNSNIKWGNTFEGLSVHILKYGIVIHGVPKDEIDPKENQDEIIEIIETENPTLKEKVTQISPLRWKIQEDDTKKHQSLIIFVNDMEAAERMIQQGSNIAKIHYDAH